MRHKIKCKQRHKTKQNTVRTYEKCRDLSVTNERKKRNKDYYFKLVKQKHK